MVEQMNTAQLNTDPDCLKQQYQLTIVKTSDQLLPKETKIHHDASGTTIN